MKARLLGYFATFLVLAGAAEGCAVINTMVSLEYETGSPTTKNECISEVTGQDLCLSLKRHKALALGWVATWAALYGFAALRQHRGE
jgi:hypothetical protein